MIEDTVEKIPANMEDFYGKETHTGVVEYLEECPECGMRSVTVVGRCRTCTFCGYGTCSL